MSWPYDEVTPVKQEIYVSGSWVDATGETRGNESTVTITRGYSSEQASLAAGTVTFNLDNRSGDWSNRNPNSQYYGEIGRNVRHRCSITGTETSLRLTDTTDLATGTYDGARAWTADKSVLDITGDIDMRIDAEADDWYGRMGHIFAAKYQPTGNQRSWAFMVSSQGYLKFFWSTDGTSANRIFVTSTVPIAATGRQIFRVTLDVNNGAAGNTVTFYTGDAIQGGTFTQLGSPVVTAGTTSIFSSSANLEVGDAAEGSDRGLFTSTLNADPFTGKIYGYQLRSSISGTVVAWMQANAQTAGTTSWSDGLSTPNTWTLEASAEISAADYRFHSEIAEMPPVWDPTGSDVYASITASDIVERLTAGEKPLSSPIYRNLIRYNLDGYWPMEDELGADGISAYAGQLGSMVDAAFGSAEGLNGSAGALSFTTDSGYAHGGIGPSGAASGTTYILWYFKMANLPGSTVDFFNTYHVGGSVYRTVVSCSATTYTLKIQDNTYTDLVNSNTAFGSGAEPTQWIAMRLLLTQSGGTVTWEWAWYPVGAPVTYGVSGTFSGTFGKPYSWTSFAYTGKSDLQLAHVALAREDLEFTGLGSIGSTNGYIGETTVARARRLCFEEQVPFWWIGVHIIDGFDYGTPMDVQGIKTLTDLLQEVADVDGGILYAPRDKFGLAIRSYYSMLNRGYPELDYTANHLSGRLVPRELRDFRNDVTCTRPSGGSGRYVQTSGTNGTDSAGLYDVSLPRSAYTIPMLEPIAEREVLFGTWDELRQTLVQVELHRAALLADSDLSAAVSALDIGTPAALTNLPVYAGGPDDALVRVLGYTEIISNKIRTLIFNGAPYGPLQVGMWGSATYPTTSRWAPRYTTLQSLATSGATSLTFRISDDREEWSATDVPYDVMIAGERITVTAMGARSGSGPYTQPATVTRSVNGIVKAQSALTPITLVDSGRWAWKPSGG